MKDNNSKKSMEDILNVDYIDAITTYGNIINEKLNERNYVGAMLLADNYHKIFNKSEDLNMNSTYATIGTSILRDIIQEPKQLTEHKLYQSFQHMIKQYAQSGKIEYKSPDEN